MFSVRINSSSKILFCFLVLYDLSKITAEMDTHPNFLRKNSETTHVATCILNILHEYVSCSDFISVAITTGGLSKQSVIKAINEDSCYSVVLTSSREEYQFTRTETYAVLTETADNVSKVISQLANHLHWNPRARFIIHTNEIKKDKINEIFKTLLTYNVYHVAVLSLKESDVLIHSYYPFENGKCGRLFEDFITLGKCDIALNSSVIFSRTASFDMRNCTVKAIVHESVPCTIHEGSNYTIFGKYYPGLEQYLLDEIAVRENLVYKYKLNGDKDYLGLVFPNRTSSGVFGLLQRGEAQLAIGGFMLMKDRAAVFDYVWGYYYENLCLFTPVLDNLGWKNFMALLGPRSWTLTILCYCLVSAISMLIAAVYPEISQGRLLLIFKLLSFFFQGNSDRGLLKIKRFRFLMCNWILLTFFISNIYNIAIYSMVTAQVKIKTNFEFHDLNHIPFKACISNTIRDSFLSAYKESLPENDATPECRYTMDSLTAVGSRKDLFTIIKKQSFMLRESEFTNSRGQKTVEAWDFANLGFIVTVMYMKKGDPLKEVIEKYAGYVVAAGLMQKHFDMLRLKSRTAISKNSKRFVKVRLQDLKIPFLALAFGSLMSLLTFSIEKIISFRMP